MSASQYTHDSPTHKIKSEYKLCRTYDGGKKSQQRLDELFVKASLEFLNSENHVNSKKCFQKCKNRDGERGLNFSLPEYY